MLIKITEKFYNRKQNKTSKMNTWLQGELHKITRRVVNECKAKSLNGMIHGLCNIADALYINTEHPAVLKESKMDSLIYVHDYWIKESSLNYDLLPGQ